MMVELARGIQAVRQGSHTVQAFRQSASSPHRLVLNGLSFVDIPFCFCFFLEINFFHPCFFFFFFFFL